MISPTLKIGLVQFDIAWEQPLENIHRIERLVGTTSEVDLLLLPEMWSTGFTMEPERVAETKDGPALNWMIKASRKLDIAIGGSVSVKDGDQFFNRWYCVFPQGQVEYYDKKHLFSYGKENEHYASGNKTKIIEINGWRVMPIICYDLRFPAWCRNKDNYDLLLIAANWPKPRIQHWDTLIQARAIENQAYVAAVNRIGEDATGLQYNGHSQVINMKGQEVLSPGVNEGVEIVVLDKQSLIDYRVQYPFLKDMDEYRL